MPISRLLKAAPAAFFVAVTPALAQSVPNHAIAVGTGGTTFNSVGPCAVGIPVVGAGASSDPVCGQSLLVQSAPDSTQIVWPESLNNPVNAAVTGYGAGLKLQNSTPAWGGNEVHKWAGVAAVAGGTYSNETDLVLYTGNFDAASNTTSAPTERMRIKGTRGNVGIGTALPATLLDVNGTARLKDLYGIADIRSFGSVVCNGSSSTGVDGAFTAAAAAGYTRFFLPKNCWWNVSTTRSNAVPGGWEIFGEDWGSSVIYVTDQSTDDITLGALTKFHNLGFRGKACRNSGEGVDPAHSHEKTCPVQHMSVVQGGGGASNYAWGTSVTQCGPTNSPPPDNVPLIDVPCMAVLQSGAGDGAFYATFKNGQNLNIWTVWDGNSPIPQGPPRDAGLLIQNGFFDTAGAEHVGIRIDNYATNSANTSGPISIINHKNGSRLISLQDTNDSGISSFTNPWIELVTNYQTSHNLINVFHAASTFAGNGIVMNMGNSGGTFSGNFLSFLVANVEKFTVTKDGVLKVQGSTGQSCSAGTVSTASMVVLGGIVTHC